MRSLVGLCVCVCVLTLAELGRRGISCVIIVSATLANSTPRTVAMYESVTHASRVTVERRSFN